MARSVSVRRLALSMPWQGDRYRLFTWGVALAAPVLLVAIGVGLYVAATPSITRFGLAFLTTSVWNPVTSRFGALSYIYGTVLTSAVALVIALPVGIGTAILLAEQRQARLRSTIGIGVELLAAIPSVVYGIWALFVMAPWVLKHIEAPVSERFGFLPIFAGPARQTSYFTATLVLAIMILPTLTAVSRDVIKAVPNGLRESAVALGATRWETTWRVILPAARNGIFGAVILALGRALGETIAVTFVIGNHSGDIQASMFAPGYTLASVIANEFTEATGQIYSAALLELGLILMIVTLTVNVVATLLVRSIGRSPA